MTESADELLGLDMGQIVKDRGCVLVSIVVRVPGPDGRPVIGRRTCAVLLPYMIMQEVVAQLERVREVASELGPSEGATVVATDWTGGPTLANPGGPLCVCTGLGLGVDAAGTGFEVFIELGELGYPDAPVQAGRYAITTPALLVMLDVMGKAMRRMEAKGATRSPGLH